MCMLDDGVAGVEGSHTPLGTPPQAMNGMGTPEGWQGWDRNHASVDRHLRGGEAVAEGHHRKTRRVEHIGTASRVQAQHRFGPAADNPDEAADRAAVCGVDAQPQGTGDEIESLENGHGAAGRRYSSVQSERPETSLTNTRFPDRTGWAHVSVVATT